ncbi:hypothetical protein H2204_005062 [Knufia peltigerae]|uniref:NAD(P)-binding domain-containing protein n=1 Tax=Knufia peltigerae TaxID=1002370 RepID=A0AA38Y7F9_9EURO|nr:hypothetical protein H2204_005062 [Knufia peltigerae]
MTEIIVLTCASGRACSPIIPLLYEESRYELRLVVHSQSSRDRLKNRCPKAEVVQADFGIWADCANVVAGASTVYYVGPPFDPGETHFGINMVDAAVTESKKPGSRFAHFVFSSAVHPELTKMLHHDRKRYVEEYLTESMLPYTILQPSNFTDLSMGPLIAQKDATKITHRALFNPETAFSFTTLLDYAEASVRVIRERSRHFYATYQTVSTLPMKYIDYLKSVAEVLGKELEVQVVAFEQSVEMMSEGSFGTSDAPQINKDGPERMLLYYNTRGLYSNPNILEWLIGRPGTTPAQLARQILDSEG